MNYLLLEVLSDREFGDNVRDAKFADSALTYKDEKTITSVVITATEITVTSAAHGLIAGDFVLIDDVVGISSTEEHDEYDQFTGRVKVAAS